MALVVYHPDAEKERSSLPHRERVALDHAREKLEAMGDQLPYPYQSNIQGFHGLRELRPRAGRSPWRAIYKRVGDVFVVAAIGPEADVDTAGFQRSITAAAKRVLEIDEVMP